MSLEDNKNLVYQYFEAFRTRNGEIYDAILGDTFCVRGLHENPADIQPEQRGPVFFKQALQSASQHFSDNQFVLDELVAEGDKVMVRWTVSGIHTGPFAGLPPTGKRITYSGVNGFRVENDKLAEAWDLWDRLTMWQQCGVLPPTPTFLAQAREKLAG